MGIGDRLRDIWRSRRPDRDSGLDDRLDASYRDQSAAVAQVRRALADLSVQRRRVELRLAAAEQQAGDAQALARERVASGDDAGARAALSEAIAAESSADEIRVRRDALVAEETRLEATVRDLEGRIEDFRGRKDTLEARRSAAEARSALHRAARDVGSAGTGDDLAAAERAARAAEATAAGYDELVADGIADGPAPDDDEVESRLRALEAAREEGPDGPDALPR